MAGIVGAVHRTGPICGGCSTTYPRLSGPASATRSPLATVIREQVVDRKSP
ncbi:hypothetical protein ACFQL7_22380 [Halocatena marina]|uniref:Uncharacterized protein n=2 Tax=Halocatena marina TaxID=2934937 RepID=A0ABD5YSG6_9EURY